MDAAYLPPVSPLVWGEIGLGVYALVTIFTLTPYMGLKIIPWMLIYSAGYFYIAGLNLIQNWQARAHSLLSLASISK